MPVRGLHRKMSVFSLAYGTYKTEEALAIFRSLAQSKRLHRKVKRRQK